MARRHDLYERAGSTISRFERESRDPLVHAFNLRKNDHIFRRALIVSIIASMRVPPVRQILPYVVIGGIPKHTDRHLGQGTEQVVFRTTGDNPTVTKIGIGKVSRRYEHAAKLAEEQQQRVDTLASYLGKYCLDTQFEPVQISLFGKSMWSVASTQADMSRASEVYTDGIVNRGALESLEPRSQISDFCDRSDVLLSEQGLYVDIFGDGNIVVDNGHLVLVDTIPRSLEDGSKPTRTPGRTMGDDLIDRINDFRSYGV